MLLPDSLGLHGINTILKNIWTVYTGLTSVQLKVVECVYGNQTCRAGSDENSFGRLCKRWIED